MGLQYISFPLQDLGSGIDQQSAENKIPEGFSENLLNFDATAEGYLAKRTGYQGHAGNLPLRVSRIEYSTASTGNICFLFDSSVDISSVDFSTVRSTPIVVTGRTREAHSGDFTNTDSTHYYSAFAVENKREFAVGANTLSIPSTEHGSLGPFLVGLAESTSSINSSNSQFLPDRLITTLSSNDLDIEYTNGTGSAISGYVIIKDKPVTGGETYLSGTFSHPDGVTTSTAIAAGTHNLANFNILARAYIDNGTIREEIIPDEVVIGPTGTVTFSITNNTGSSFNVRFLLIAVPVANLKTGTVAANSTGTIILTNLDGDFVFASCYLETSPGGDREQVIPDSIEVDASTLEATITFQNNAGVGRNFYIFWETAKIPANKLCVTGTTIGAPYSEDEPQLTLWGLDHSEIYGNTTTATRPGWVNHLDSYRTAADTRLIAGLGGNLFQAQEGNTSITYYPNMRNRVNSATVLGPTFVDSTDTSDRTRGYISFTGAGEGWAKGTAATWVSGNLVKYTLSAPSFTVNGTLSTIIKNTDYLTVQGAGYRINEGTFKVSSVTLLDANTIEITVENDARDSADWDETDSGMRCGIFTDDVPLFTPSTFIPDDAILSNAFSESVQLTCLESDSSTLIVDGATEEIALPAGLVIAGQRTANVLPLQDTLSTPTVESLVRGDMASLGTLERKLRIQYINPLSDEAVTIDGDGTAATVTLSAATTAGLAIGQSIILLRAGLYTGIHTITDVLSGTEFTFDTAESITGQAGILQGKTVQLDETLQIADAIDFTTPLSVTSRWIPIEAPDDSFDLTPNATYRYFDAETYGDQPILRSVTVADNLYLTNSADEVLKFDGTNLYRAGITRWQPQLFLSVDTNPPAPETGKIDVEDITCSTAGANWTTNKFIVSPEDKNTFAVGTKIRYSASSPTFIVERVDEDNTNGYIIVDRNIGGTPASSTLRKVHTFKYYYRLNAVDANDNIIASAVTGAEDNVVELVEDSQVRHRLIGLPVLGTYDYDRLEVEIYRTKADTPAPFYRLATVPLSFNNNDGYVDYIDTDADDTLVDLDPTSSFFGQELGQTWAEPQRAKYITSLGNKLVLGNIKGYPKLDMQLVDQGIRITASVLSGKKFLFRKDNTATGTATNNTDIINYEFVTSGAVTIAPATDIANNAGASFTITSASHGLDAGDWVYLYKSAVADGNLLQYAGWWMINSADANTFTILHSHSATYTPSTDDVDRFITATSKLDVPVFLGTDGNYGQLSANPSVTGPYQFTALKRLANAINTSMRKVDSTAIGDFTPWLIGNAGSEYQFGQCVITSPTTLSTTPEVVLPSFSGFQIFINGIKRSGGNSVSMVTNLFPSRVIVSFSNYPELFDNPESVLDTDSLSAIDINPADGQEITGIIPFFGESAFGAAQRDSVLLVFKTNSIYLVNLAAKDAGQNAVQKIDSRGLGCTAPYSIAPTKNGIMFANESGIYRLNYTMEITYIGRRLERLWKQSVDKSNLSMFTGHYHAIENKYKLSVAYKQDDQNDKVLVYNTTREYQADGYRDGSWTVYDNHPAIGWANLQTEAFFASTGGRVFSMRNTGLESDFRDDSAAINAVATLRAIDFGEPAIRKAVVAALLQYRILNTTTGTTISSAANLTDDFQPLDRFTLTEPTDSQDGLSDKPDVKVKTLRYAISNRKVVYIQLKIENSSLDEAVEVSGVSFRVAGLNRKGIEEAADT
jgi:hypothetical protein